MKGYELYSWKEGETWNYTLITATNRLKSFDESLTRKCDRDRWVGSR